MAVIKKLIKFFFCLILLVVGMALIALYLAPIRWANYILPERVQLNKTSGTPYRGSVQRIMLRNKAYNLNCHYRQQGIGLDGIRYRVNCTAPLSLQFLLQIDYAQTITFTEVKLSGELANAKQWLALFRIPSTANGRIEMSIDKAVIKDNTLAYLALNSHADYLCLLKQPTAEQIKTRKFRQDCLADITTSTTNAALSNDVPIQLLSTTDAQSNTHRILVMKTEIDGKQLSSAVEITNSAEQNNSSRLKSLHINMLFEGKIPML